MLAPGSTIAGYEVERVVGSGGTGMAIGTVNGFGSVIVNGVLFTAIANVAVNGVGRNGRPNGTSGSKS